MIRNLRVLLVLGVVLPGVCTLESLVQAKDKECPGLQFARVFSLEDKAEVFCLRSRAATRSEPQWVVWVSKSCAVGECTAWSWLTGSRKKRTDVFSKFNQAQSRSTDVGDGANPASLFCQFMGAVARTGRDSSGNEEPICQAKDGSMIAAWDLYSHYQP